ncbi:MAG: inositol polyphosphate kinase family protein [Halanaerobiales bacterium]
MDKRIINLRDYLNELGIILSFTGPFSQGVVEEIGDALKIYMENKENTKNEIFRVFSVFIEQTQNIRNYLENSQGQEDYNRIIGSAIVVIARREDKYLIRSGNLVRGEDIGVLQGIMDEILQMNKEDLKTIYKKRLMSSYKDGENNAHLGLIDIARKSTSMEYEIEEVDDKFYFFSMSVLV